jgi:Tol biopolymer transport system component
MNRRGQPVCICLLLGAILVACGPSADIPSASERIAFASDRDDPNPVECFPLCNYEIYVMNADGSGQTNLTNNPARDIIPAWSP